MSITFAIEARTAEEAQALAVEDAPTMNVHNAGACLVFTALGLDLACSGTIDAAELLDRIDHGPRHPAGDWRETRYVTERLPRLREIAAAALRLGRQVGWS